MINFRNNFGIKSGAMSGYNMRTILGTILRTILRTISETIFRTIHSSFFLILSGIRTECPSGTKCVAEFFCNENAIMVAYRVNLTPAQKKQRGSLTVSFSNINNNELPRVSHHFFKSHTDFPPYIFSGNALERVQRVHEPADLWDITFCTR